MGCPTSAEHILYRYRDREIPMETINFHDDRGGDLAISWGFILRMMHMFSTCKPHEGYDLVRKICEQKNMKRESSTFVFTSNIDGYFERAGFDRDSLYECHGSTNYLQCIDLCKRRAKNEVYHIDEFNKPKADKNTIAVIAGGETSSSTKKAYVS